MINESDFKSSELSFLGSDPGAVKFGNFINYYSFHNVQLRINNLHPSMFPTSQGRRLVCLDIGCNTGDLTKKLYKYLKSIYPECDVHILAVDIDSTLIQRAKESNEYPNICFMTANIMEEIGRQHIHNYLDSCNSKIFDVTFCFSVTMWIHLNNGDEGLLEFLKFLTMISKTIIIEPQPWNCYRNAQRRIKKSGDCFDLYESLKIRSNVDSVIEKIIIENTFTKTYESASSSWNRKVVSFQNIDNTP